MGGIDWAGLPVIVAMLGINDVELLCQNFLAIRSHDADRPDLNESNNDGDRDTFD